MAVDFKIFLASPRGFCAGVERAIETVKICLRKYSKPVYVLHEIVHNKHVIMELEQAGAVFVENLQDIPKNEVCIFSAHGVSTTTEIQAKELGLHVVDATCTLVSLVHRIVEKYNKLNFDIVIIGHHKHPEVEGTAGRVVGRVHVVANEEEAKDIEVLDADKVVYVTQTTLNEDEIIGIVEVLKQKFPNIKGPGSNICFATRNRQNAVKHLAKVTKFIFVVGSKNSSNSNRLKEVARQCGAKAYLIDDSDDLDPKWLEGEKTVGLTAGASAPERLVKEVLCWLQDHGATETTELIGIREDITFKPANLPSTLK